MLARSDARQRGEFFPDRAIEILRAILIEAAQARIDFDEESVLGLQSCFDRSRFRWRREGKAPRP